ncbi:MAG: gamma-glutamylcyclotransferase [Methylocella sp.]
MDKFGHFYFAYGSNLNDWRGLGLRPVGPATLPDEVLVFDHHSSRRDCGTLNIRRRRGGLVEGYLFAATRDGWRALDRKEGHPRSYRRETVTVLNAKGREVKAETYRSMGSCGFVQPNEAYLDICRKGRERFELGTEELDLAAANEVRSVCDAVFVYGTLMRGESRALVWRDLNLDCALLAQARGTLHNHGSYPGMELEGDGIVEGEFLRFKNIEDALARFDPIEGFMGFGNDKNLFRRTLSTFHVGEGRSRRAWSYVTTRPEAPAIESNDWRMHRGVRQVVVEAIVAAHAGRTRDFLDRLAWTPTSPFDTIPFVTSRMADVVDDVLHGRLSERTLARASEDWAVPLPLDS